MRPSIDQVRTAGTYLRTFNWDMTFARFPKAGAPYPSSDALNIRCTSVEVPKMKGEDSTVNIRGHQVNQPGVYSYSGTISLEFVETVDVLINDFLKRWRDACWSPKTGRTAPKPDLEAIVILHLLDTNDVPVWQYTLKGCYLSDYDSIGGRGLGGESGIISPKLTLTYDYFEDSRL